MPGMTQPFQHRRCPRATPRRIDDKIGVAEERRAPGRVADVLGAAAADHAGLAVLTRFERDHGIANAQAADQQRGATGDAKYMNQELLHTSNPFKDPGDGTKAYNVYKILYDAVANGYTEDD